MCMTLMREARHRYLVENFERQVHKRVRRIVVYVEVKGFQQLFAVLEIQGILEESPIC
jgi:hypothetical protein